MVPYHKPKQAQVFGMIEQSPESSRQTLASTTSSAGIAHAQRVVEPNPLVDLVFRDVRELIEPKVTSREPSTPPTFSPGVVRNLYGTLVGLHTKIVGAEVLRIGLHAVGVSVALPQIILHGAWVSVALVAASVVVGLRSLREELLVQDFSLAKLEAFSLWTTSPRVCGMVDDLVQSSKVSLPQTYVVPGQVANAAMCDRIFKQDVVICSESLVATLNDQELKGILAHELAHAGRSLRKFYLCSKILRSASLPSCILGASLGLLENGAVIPLAFAGGLLGGMGLDTALARLNAYISRQTELKTDLRAVAMTGDAESLISALEKLTAGEPAAGSLSTHPSTHERASLIRRVFG